MRGEGAEAISFYTKHPISLQIIIAKLTAARGRIDDLQPEELFPHDQDHYGGLEANDALAECARIGAGSRVADFCAGLGGPARYYAHRYGAEVTGIELTPARIAGANVLTRLVGLQDRVAVIGGNVMCVPLAGGSMDAVVSQEALLHVSDKTAALREAYRVLRHGGRLAFTDWIVRRPLAEADAELMWQGMAVQTIQSVPAYRDLLDGIGFRTISVDDMSEHWGVVLQQRLAMYRALREEALRAGTPAGDEAFFASYVRLVALMLDGTLGGARIAAEK